ncbi:MAG: 4-hydroxy-3-methylbut-2-enyl diphosphate reductase [Chloroflexi bacterium RBG_16_57_8]|nr:MAG: 4-hydroxy-3-methylbut-2-enyl diphosphate reductase [Chloroflexi bacterium RBG_16_57_8]
MSFLIEKAARTGFCPGVKRAMDIVTRAAAEHGHIETLGAVVHNQQVIDGLIGIGVEVVKRVEDIKGKVVVTSSHGVSPEVDDLIKSRGIEAIGTVCGDVRRAQVAARRLAEAGFLVIVYGDANHPEVKGILGWAKGEGIATVDDNVVAALNPMPRRVGVLSQTTQVPDSFAAFAKRVVDLALKRDAEIRIIDTLCHELRERQASAVELARRADLMLVVGGRSSANTNRLAELCSQVTETHLIETAEEILPGWLTGKKLVGITAGASTAEETVNEVVARLEALRS